MKLSEKEKISEATYFRPLISGLLIYEKMFAIMIEKC